MINECLKDVGRQLNIPINVFHQSNAARKGNSVYMDRFSLHLYFVTWYYLFIRHSSQQYFRHHLYTLTSLFTSINAVFGECKKNIYAFNPLNAELNPTCPLLTLFGTHSIFHVSMLGVKECICIAVGPDSVVDIAIRYGLGGPGIESRWRRDLSHPSRRTLGPTQPPIKWAPCNDRR